MKIIKIRMYTKENNELTTLTLTDDNLIPREIEKKAAELAYFLRVPLEVF